MNLDGETNLKAKKAPTDCVYVSSDDSNILRNLNNATISCDPHNEFIYKSDGKMNLHDTHEEKG